MSLPINFNNPEDYFGECLHFLNEYNYLYNVSNVDILIHDVFDKITANDEEFDVFDEDIALAEVNDDFLSEFFTKLKKLQSFYEDFRPGDIELDTDISVSDKKKHEILYLAKEIKTVCENIDCDVVVDFGAGLGYLDQLLFQTSNYKVLGIECNKDFHAAAKRRQRKFYEDSIEHVKYVKHRIQRESREDINDFLQKKFESPKKVCITGLHACADLTIDALDIFLQMKEAAAIVIMPCCYHKMKEENSSFKNFPLSKCFKQIFERFNGKENMKVPFLRLATQPPNVNEKLSRLVFNLLSRAVLQLFAYKHNYRLKRNKRKAVKTKTMDNNFDAYIQDAATNGFTLIKNEFVLSDEAEDPSFDFEELKTLWNEVNQTKLNKAGIYIALQNHLQPVLENLVLYDRLVYLKENGVHNCSFKKILDAKTSPRCLALVAYKDN